MKYIGTLALCAAITLMISVVAVPQDIKHAPTLESCVADLNLWTSEIPGYPDATLDQVRSAISSLTTHELEGRRKSLGECALSYPVLANSKRNEISATQSLTMYYETETEIRYSHFLLRHNLLDKFRAEDVAGQR